MHNLVLSPIDPEVLINSISDRITANILKSVTNQQNQIEAPEQLFTIEEASTFLNLSVATLYSKVSRNELPYMKRSKRLYFSRTELLDYLKKGRRKSQSEIEQEAEAFLSNKNKG